MFSSERLPCTYSFFWINSEHDFTAEYDKVKILVPTFVVVPILSIEGTYIYRDFAKASSTQYFSLLI